MNSSIKIKNVKMQSKKTSPFPHKEMDKSEELRDESNIKPKNNRGIQIRTKVTCSGFQDAINRKIKLDILQPLTADKKKQAYLLNFSCDKKHLSAMNSTNRSSNRFEEMKANKNQSCDNNDYSGMKRRELLTPSEEPPSPDVTQTIMNYKTLEELNKAFFSHKEGEPDKVSRRIQFKQKESSYLEDFTNQKIQNKDRITERKKCLYKIRENKIMDCWMNQKCDNLIRNNGEVYTNRLNSTSIGFAKNLSMTSSQYTNRNSFQNRDCQSSTPARDIVVERAQKYKYKMDKLKLLCNKTTFLKFYDLKRMSIDQSKLNGVVIQIKDKLWKPQVREEATMEVVIDSFGQSKGYLINGFHGEGIKQIVQFTVIK